jgi:hypothetical protein
MAINCSRGNLARYGACMSYLAACIAPFIGSDMARADVLPPGHKPVRCSARFENLADFPSYVFYSAYRPVDRYLSGSGTVSDPPLKVDAIRLDPANAVTELITNDQLGKQYLLAVPKELAENSENKPDPDWFDGKTPGVLQVELGGGYRSAPVSEQRSELWTVYKVYIVPSSNGQAIISLDVVSKEGWRQWYVAGGVGLIALVIVAAWLISLRRQCRKAASSCDLS